MSPPGQIKCCVISKGVYKFDDEIGTYFIISDVEKGGVGSVGGRSRRNSRSELFAFYRCYILRVRVLCRFDAWLMFRVEPDLAHDQTVNGYLHDTTEEELKGLTF